MALSYSVDLRGQRLRTWGTGCISLADLLSLRARMRGDPRCIAGLPELIDLGRAVVEGFAVAQLAGFFFRGISGTARARAFVATPALALRFLPFRTVPGPGDDSGVFTDSAVAEGWLAAVLVGRRTR